MIEKITFSVATVLGLLLTATLFVLIPAWELVGVQMKSCIAGGVFFTILTFMFAFFLSEASE